MALSLLWTSLLGWLFISDVDKPTLDLLIQKPSLLAVCAFGLGLFFLAAYELYKHKLHPPASPKTKSEHLPPDFSDAGLPEQPKANLMTKFAQRFEIRTFWGAALIVISIATGLRFMGIFLH
jgi:hypothetical protein